MFEQPTDNKISRIDHEDLLVVNESLVESQIAQAVEKCEDLVAQRGFGLAFVFEDLFDLVFDLKLILDRKSFAIHDKGLTVFMDFPHEDDVQNITKKLFIFLF